MTYLKEECKREKQTNSMIWQALMHPVFPCCLFCLLHTEELFVLLSSCWMWVINSLASGPGTNISCLIYLNRMIDLGQCDCRPSLSCTAPQEHTSGELQASTVLLLQDLFGLNWRLRYHIHKHFYSFWEVFVQVCLVQIRRELSSALGALKLQSSIWDLHSLTDGFRKAGKNRLSNSACQLLQSVSRPRGSSPVNPPSATEHLSFHILAGGFVNVDHLREGFLFRFQVSFPTPPLLQLFPLRLVMEKSAFQS